MDATSGNFSVIYTFLTKVLVGRRRWKVWNQLVAFATQLRGGCWINHYCTIYRDCVRSKISSQKSPLRSSGPLASRGGASPDCLDYGGTSGRAVLIKVATLYAHTVYNFFMLNTLSISHCTYN